MIVKKILNNNVVTSNSEDGQEIIVVGSGIGWNQKPGSLVNPNKVEKIFRMDTATSTARLKQLFLEVNVESIRVSSEIVDYAKRTLNKELKKNIYITLTDHIDFAVERCAKGINFQTPLYWEIRNLYAQEFQVGLYALELIEKHMGVTLPEGEAASIALHLVNAEYDGDLSRTEFTIDIVSTSLSIVRLLTGVPFHEDSLDYQRFVTHLMFFAQRALNHKTLDSQGDILYDAMKSGHPKELQCAEKIAKYVERQYQVPVGREELTFLTIHIVRVLNSGKPQQD